MNAGPDFWSEVFKTIFYTVLGYIGGYRFAQYEIRKRAEIRRRKKEADRSKE